MGPDIKAGGRRAAGGGGAVSAVIAGAKAQAVCDTTAGLQRRGATPLYTSRGAKFAAETAINRRAEPRRPSR